MTALCYQKQQLLIEKFSTYTTPEEIYQQIMAWGKELSPFNSEWKTEANLVSGCQSVMYLNSNLQGDRIFFAAASDALISAGLAALLIHVYSGETPEEVLTCPPKFLEEIGIPASLTPGRANGLASLYLKMKQEALKAIVKNKNLN